MSYGNMRVFRVFKVRSDNVAHPTGRALVKFIYTAYRKSAQQVRQYHSWRCTPPPLPTGATTVLHDDYL